MLLFLQVHNGGTHAVRVLDGLVAQDGAEPDQSAGGLSAGMSSGRPLEPGRTGEIFVRVQLACGPALQGPPATRLLLVSQVEGRRPLMQAVRIDGLAEVVELPELEPRKVMDRKTVEAPLLELQDEDRKHLGREDLGTDGLKPGEDLTLGHRKLSE